MKNKFLIELKVPKCNLKLNMYVPNNRKVGTIKKYICGYLNENTNYEFEYSNVRLIDADTGVEFSNYLYVKDTNIKNGTKIVIS